MVDLEAGELVGERYRLDTPSDATPESVSKTVGEVAATFDHHGLCGVTFPGVIQNGVVKTAANLDDGWIGTSLTNTVGSALPGLRCS